MVVSKLPIWWAVSLPYGVSLRNLCVLGYAEDQRLLKTFDYFISTQQEDRGWKCNKYSFGRGPETEHSTPMTTLTLLDAFRYSPFGKNQAVIHPAIEFLLTHWRLKSQSVLVIMALARCSCRRNILLGDIISFIICMFYPFTLMRNEMSAFEALHQFETKISRGQSHCRTCCAEVRKDEFL